MKATWRTRTTRRSRRQRSSKMATTIPMRPKRGPRVRESAPGGAVGRDAQYDLLTAALIGAAIGATATLMLRLGPSGQRPVAPVLRGARWAGREALAAGGVRTGSAGSARSTLPDLRRALRRQRKRLGVSVQAVHSGTTRPSGRRR